MHKLSTSLVEYLNLFFSRSKTAKTAHDSCWFHIDSCWFYFCSKIIWLFQWVFVKINVKFEFLDLNYLYFDTKHICFGRCCSHGLQTAINYEVASWLRSSFIRRYFRIPFVKEPPICREDRHSHFSTNQKCCLMHTFLSKAVAFLSPLRAELFYLFLSKVKPGQTHH